MGPTVQLHNKTVCWRTVRNTVNWRCVTVKKKKFTDGAFICCIVDCDHGLCLSRKYTGSHHGPGAYCFALS